MSLLSPAKRQGFIWLQHNINQLVNIVEELEKLVHRCQAARARKWRDLQLTFPTLLSSSLLRRKYLTASNLLLGASSVGTLDLLLANREEKDACHYKEQINTLKVAATAVDTTLHRLPHLMRWRFSNAYRVKQLAHPVTQALNAALRNDATDKAVSDLIKEIRSIVERCVGDVRHGLTTSTMIELLNEFLKQKRE